jgi:hypothetical protein
VEGNSTLRILALVPAGDPAALRHLERALLAALVDAAEREATR